MAFESRLELTVDSRSGERRLKGFEQRLDRTEQAGERASRGIGMVTAAIGAAGAAVGGFSVSRVISETAKFQDSMLGLQAVSGATEKQMKSLEKQARTLGATSMFSAQQAGQAQRFLAQAGFEVNETLSATPGILNLATAGQMNLAQAADIASNVLGGMRLEVEELNRVNDVLAATAAGSNTSISQLGQALSTAAPLAASAGVSIEETAAAIGTLSDAGVQASRAGTGLQGVFRQLSNVTPQARDALASYGVSMQDVNIEANGLGSVLETLREANISTSDAFKIFGSEAGAAAQILISGSRRVDQFSGSLRDAEGAAKEAALVLGSGLTGSMRSFTSALSESVLQLGDSGLAGGFQSVTDTASGVLSVYNGMLPAFVRANGLTEDQADNLETMAGALSAAAGAAGALSGAYVTTTAATWGFHAAQRALNAAVRANPYVAAGSAVIALGGALYGARDATISLGNSQGSVSQLVQATWQETGSTISDAMGESLSYVDQAILQSNQEAQSFAGDMWVTFQNLMGNIADITAWLVNKSIGSFVALGPATATIAQGIFENFRTAFVSIGDFAAAIPEAITSMSAEPFKQVARDTAGAFVDNFDATVSEVGSTVRDAMSTDYIGDAMDYAGDAVSGFADRVVNRVNVMNMEFQSLNGHMRDLGDTSGDIPLQTLGEWFLEIPPAASDAADGIDDFGDSSDDAAESSSELAKELERQSSELESLRRELDPAYAAGQKLAESTELLDAGLANGTVTLTEYLDLWDKAADVYGEATTGTDDQAKSLESLASKYDQHHQKAAQLEADLKAIDRQYKAGAISGAEYQRMVGNVRDEMHELALESDPVAQEMARAWEEAADRIDETFADAFSGAFDSFEDFSDQLLDGFKQLLAELAYQATLKPIVVEFTGQMQGMFGGGGQQGSLFGGGQGGGFDTSTLIKGGKWGYDQLFGSASAGAGGTAAVGYGGSGWASSVGTNTYGGWAGNASGAASASGGSLAGGAMSGLYTAGAGMAGGWAGSEVGGMVSDKQANSNIGQSAGTAVGAYVGSVVPGIGTAIGAAAGGFLGGLGDTLFGSGGSDLDLALRRAPDDQYGNTGIWDKNIRARGGLGVVGFDEDGSHEIKDLWDVDEAQKLIDGIAQLDTAVASLAETPDQLAAMRDAVMASNRHGIQGHYGETSHPDQVLDRLTDRYKQAIDSLDSEFEPLLMRFDGTSDKLVALATSLDVVEEAVGDNASAMAEARSRLDASDDILATAQTLNQQAQAMGVLDTAADRLNLTFDATAAGALAAAGNLAEMVGGVEQLSSLQQSYYQAFYSEAERQERQAEALREQFAALNMTMPDTRQQFRDLVEAQNLNTEAGRETYLELLNLAGAFDQVAQETSQLERAAMSSIEGALASYNSVSDTAAAVADQRRDQLEDEKRALESIRGLLSDLAIGDASVLSADARLAAARGQWGGIVNRAGQGDTDAISELSGASQSYLDLARGNASTALEYARIYGQVTGDIADLEDQYGESVHELGSIESIAADQLRMQEQARETLIEQLTTQIGMLDGIHTFSGLLQTLPSDMASQISGIIATQSEHGQVLPDGTYVDDSGFSGQQNTINDLYNDILGRNADESGLDYWTGRLSSGTSLDRIRDEMEAQAADGYHAKGIADVPFDNYRAVLHKGEDVLPAPIAKLYREGAPDAGNAELIAEVRALRRELEMIKGYARTTADSTSQTANLNRRWEFAGTPPVRA